MAISRTKRKRGVQTPLPVFTLARAPVKNSTQEPPFVNSSDLEARESPNEARYSAYNGEKNFKQRAERGREGRLTKEPKGKNKHIKND
jgi:hypothetical protein